MRNPDDAGTLEPVSAQDLAELERERQTITQHAAEPSRSAPTEALPPVRNWSPPLIEVELHATTVTLRLHANRLDLAGAQRAGRERILQLVEETNKQFTAGETWAEVLRLRQRQTQAREAQAAASEAVQKAEAEHTKAAADGATDAAKLWGRVVKLRDEQAGQDRVAVAIGERLKAAEEKAAGELAAALAAARKEAAEKIFASRKKLHEDLLAALKPILEAWHSETCAASELSRQMEKRPALPV
jgi:hypothetical protein